MTISEYFGKGVLVFREKIYLFRGFQYKDKLNGSKGFEIFDVHLFENSLAAKIEWNCIWVVVSQFQLKFSLKSCLLSITGPRCLYRRNNFDDRLFSFTKPAVFPHFKIGVLSRF